MTTTFVERTARENSESYQIESTDGEENFSTVRARERDEKCCLFRWKFAFEVIADERVRPRLNAYRWTSIHEDLRRMKEYREIYVKHLNEKTSKEEKQIAEVILSLLLFLSLFN